MRQLGGEKLGPNYSEATRATRIAPMVSDGIVSRAPGGVVGVVVKASAASSRSFERTFLYCPRIVSDLACSRARFAADEKITPTLRFRGTRVAVHRCGVEP